MRARARGGRLAVIGIPYAWLLVFFLLPFLVVARISVSEMETTTIKDIVTWTGRRDRLQPEVRQLPAARCRTTCTCAPTPRAWLYAAVTTVLCLVIGYPFAYFMARSRRSLQPALLMLVMLPFWTSFLLRVYAWKALLTEQRPGRRRDRAARTSTGCSPPPV